MAYSNVFLPALLQFLPATDDSLLNVVRHVNPNRFAFLQELASIYPGQGLIASNPGAMLLEGLWNQRKLSPQRVKEVRAQPLPNFPPLKLIRQEAIQALSHGRSLLLVPAPTPRWPGGLLASEETLGLLISGKFFST